MKNIEKLENGNVVIDGEEFEVKRRKAVTKYLHVVKQLNNREAWEVDWLGYQEKCSICIDMRETTISLMKSYTFSHLLDAMYFKSSLFHEIVEIMGEEDLRLVVLGE